MSSLLSCFGKKSKVKRGNKEPKDRKKEAKHKEQIAAPIEDERKPPVEESIPDKALLNGDIHTEEEAEIPPPEETSSPLIKELETKLQKRREQNSTSDEHTAEVKGNEATTSPEKAKPEQTSPEQVPPKPSRSLSEKKAVPIPAENDSQVEKLRSEIAQLRTENIKLREKASENDRLKKVETEKSELEEKMKNLEELYQQLQAQEKKLSTEYAEFKKTVTKEDTTNDEVNERLGLALKERQDILASFEELSKLCCNLAPRLDSIESSQEKRETPNDVIPRVEKLGESQKTVSKNVTTLRNHLDELELRIIRLEVDKDDLEAPNGENLAALEETKKENSALMARIKKLEVELEGKKSNLLRVENEKTLMSSQLTVLMKEVENLKKKTDELSIAHGEKEAELEKSLRNHSSLNEEIKLQGIKLQTMASLVKEREDACNKAEKKLKESKKLNEELIKRLHEHEKKHGSPAKMNGAAVSPAAPLADDMDRMRKISERFAVELYGGLWREAFEKLTTVFKREEKKSLQILMDFCTEAYLHCRRTARQQLDSVYSLLTNPSVAHGRNSISRRSPSSKQSTPENIPPSLRHQIVQFRKDPTRDFLDSLYDDFLSVLDFQKSRHLRSFHMKEVKDIAPYITRCLAISWEMVVQDPPMYLQFKVRHGTPVDREKYSFYSNEGDVVDYLVWPAVLREENGTVLHKGIVQALSPRPM